MVFDRARLDVPRPAHHQRYAVAAFPGFALLTLERRDAAVGESYGLWAVVAGEHDNGVIQLADVFQLLEDIADVVVQLLHAGFVNAPVLAALLAHVRYWHLADMLLTLADVCFWIESGHGSRITKCLLMTPKRT